MAKVAFGSTKSNFEIQTTKYQDRQISTTNPVEKCNKIYMQKWDPVFEASGCVAHSVSSTPVPPRGYSSTSGVPKGAPLHKGKHGGRTRDRHSAIRRGSAIWPHTHPTRSAAIFELVNTVVNEVRKRAFSAPAIDLVCRRPRCGKRNLKWRCVPVRPSILAIASSHGNYLPC